MSSRKNSLAPYLIISAGDLSGDLTSEVTGIVYQDNIVIQCNVTGAPAGDFSVQVSTDYVPGANNTQPPQNAGNWTTVGTLSVTGPDTLVFDVNQMSAPFIRLIYTDTSGGSGSGSVNAYVAGKQV